MIRRLIILLLIVGCAPTTATFYIGMPIVEFENNNPNIKETIDNKSERERLYVDEDVGYGFRYLFYFENDTLFAVYHGLWNVIKEKEILNRLRITFYADMQELQAQQI